MGLSPENLRAYFDQGYLVLPDFFPADRIDAMVAEIERSMADPAVFAANRGNFSFALDKAAGKHYVLQALRSENLSGTIREALRSPEVLALAASVLGPDVDLFQAKLVFKKADGGAEVPWHQDFDYWKTLSKSPLHLNFGIYLDDATVENGCLEVIPGSHRAGLANHSDRKGLLNFPIRFDAVPEAGRARPIEGRKGTVILFTALTAHHSNVNASPRRRLFLNLVFSPAGNERASASPAARPALARKTPAFDVKRELEAGRIPAVWGPGPHGGQCAGQYLTKELWKHAITESDPGLTEWVYVHDNQAGDTAPEWFKGRRKGDVHFTHMRNGGEAHASGPDAHYLTGDLMDNVLAGRFQEVLRGDIAILILQSRDYWTVKRLLDHFSPRLKPGSMLVLENLFEGPGWEDGAAYALVEFARNAGYGIQYRSRNASGLLARLGPKDGYRAEYAAAPWRSNTQGISTGFGIPAAPKERVPLNPLKGIKRILRPLREDAFPSPFFRDFFPMKEIPQFKGGNLPGACCGTGLRRKELWKYALSFVADPSLAWCEFGVGEGESFDWFALNKPAGNTLFGFDSFQGIPEAWASAPKGQWRTAAYAPNRDDVKIVIGLYDESLTQPAIIEALGPRLGFIHIDCDLYKSTRMVFESVKNKIGPGTVIVFDEFYGYQGWQKHEAKAFFELIQARKLEIEYLARSDMQVALRVVSIGTGWSRSVREPRWSAGGNGIRLDRGEDLYFGYSARKLGGYAKVLLNRAKRRTL